MTIEDGVATIEDIDKSAATNTVAPDAPAGGSPPAAESAPAESVTAPTEPQGSGEPDEPKAAPQDGEPEWFKKRLSEISRQRRNEERRADRLAAELESLRKQVQPAPQPKAPEPRQQDYADYAAFTRAQAEHAARETVRAEIEAATKAGAEQAEARESQRLTETFLAKAQAQAEEAAVDLDAVMETLSAQPLLSRTVVEHLANSESAAKMAEFLALNPGELQRVSMMGPTLARKELAKLEAGLKPAAAKPPATKAPPPGPTVGGRGVTSKPVDKMDMEEFATHFMAEQEARLKRM